MKLDCCCFCDCWWWLWCSVDDGFVDVVGIAVGSGRVVVVYEGFSAVDCVEMIVALILLELLGF